MEYEYIKKLYYNSIYNIKNIEENIQMLLLSMIGFFLPFVLSHPQIIVGIIVNAMLIIGATYLRGHKILPLILLPSIGVLTAGIIFGTYTIFLLYLIPFIWLGNAIYVYVYKHVSFRENTWKGRILGVGIASILKVGFLLGITFLLVQLLIVPIIFLTVMGLLQLVTALIGGIVAVGVVDMRKKLSIKKD
ncbi:MAG: hypothetical protein ACP5OA_00505 [Candidatus Woesearchaeota archaeon]